MKAATVKSYSERCTAQKPAPDAEASRGWVHPDIMRVYEGTLFEEFECPHCGGRWKAAKKR